MRFRYFSCTPGCVVSRFGTGATIGARYVPGEGYEFVDGAVVAIPEDEVRRYTREYANALRISPLTGKAALVERTREEYEEYQATIGADAIDDEGYDGAGVDDSFRSDGGAPPKPRRRRKSASGGDSR